MCRIWKTEISQVNGSPESLGILIAIVREGDSISEIIFREFGRVDEPLVEAVQGLNPEFEDLNQIDVGQKIRLPQNLKGTNKKSGAKSHFSQNTDAKSKDPKPNQ